MHISTVNILQTVTEEALQLPTHWKSHVAFRLAYLHLTLAHSKGQGYVQFD